MKYPVAERFFSVQGEGLFSGTPMAFIRLVGCSVGKRICQHCDTDFDTTLPWLGGGEFNAAELALWTNHYKHVCLTGGEPFDHETAPLVHALRAKGKIVHVETSGTVAFDVDKHGQFDHICVSPKPGFRDDMLEIADEIKVIVPGLGINPPPGTHWFTLDEARFWARKKVVFLQPRNGKLDIDKDKLALCQQLVDQHPELRLSVQLHKVLRVR